MGYTEKTILALQAARAGVGALPVSIPALSIALDAALKIAELAKSVKDTRKACERLAERAEECMVDVYEELKGCGTAVDGAEAQKGVVRLLSVLDAIQCNMERKQERNVLKSVWNLAKNKSDLEELSQALEDARNNFLVRAAIRTDGRLAAIGEQQQELVRHAQDSERVDDALLSAARTQGTVLVEVKEYLALIAASNDRFRLRMTEMKLLEKLDEDCEMEGTGEEAAGVGGRGIVRFRAEMYADKSLLVVKRFPRRDRTFTDEVELLKGLWHPNIVQLRGYSLAPEIAFIAFNMEQHVGSFEALSHEMSAVERLLWVLDATKQVHSALQHLAGQSVLFHWIADEANCNPLTSGTDLVVKPNASVVLDVSRWGLQQHQLPNLLVLYDWAIHLNSQTRGLIQGVCQHYLSRTAARLPARTEEVRIKVDDGALKE
ncbi:hypothetical protein BC628DRAFT_919211 [Trametes gibbosa]|nr:hypothetical protein BC628DRAFT_919211 [Trametes gibbosa]